MQIGPVYDIVKDGLVWAFLATIASPAVVGAAILDA